MTGKYDRELGAAKRTFEILDEPLYPDFLNFWMEFETEKTPDAIFACAVDRIMPFLLNVYGSAKSWTEADVNVNQVENIVGKAVKRASDEMGEAFDVLLKKALDEGKLIK